MCTIKSKQCAAFNLVFKGKNANHDLVFAFLLHLAPVVYIFLSLETSSKYFHSRLATVTRFPMVYTSCMPFYSLVGHGYMLFPRLTRFLTFGTVARFLVLGKVSCFSAFGPVYTFSRAWNGFVFSRAWHQFRNFTLSFDCFIEILTFIILVSFSTL